MILRYPNLLCVIELVLVGTAMGGVPVVINELVANPGQSTGDWVELYNAGSKAVDVGGMYLTDDLARPTKWKIPTGRTSLTTVASKGFLRIWTDKQTSAAGVHASFDLSADGEQIGLFDKDGTTLIDGLTFGRQDPGVSLGRYPDGAANWLFFGTPSPGTRNTNPFLGEVADPEFSYDRGFFDAPISVTITTPTPDAAVFYTLDGSSPLDPDSKGLGIYVTPIPITRTTCLRAAAVQDGWKSSHVRTCTYLFLKDAIRQPKNPSGLPSFWGSTAADYEMDPRITNNAEYGPLMEQALLSLPTVSIVTAQDSLFGPAGIYTNSTSTGSAWERPTSVEWIYPDGTTGFQADAGLRIYGGQPFRGMGLTRKKSFRLIFKGDYGPTKLDFPMFDTPGAATSFDTVILRAGANDGWNNWGNVNTQYIIDEFMRRTQLAVGQPSAHGTFVHVYLNGLYWGLYNATERPDSSFCSTYLGGDKEEWDALNSGEPKGQGNADTWNAMLSLARAGLSDNASYQKIQGNNPDGTRNPAYNNLLDVDNYTDWLFHNFWGGTGDWPWHNWYAACRRPPNTTGFKIFDWDAEGAIIVWSSLTANVTGSGDGAAEPFRYLRQNDEFRQVFGDHAHRNLFNYGAATAAMSAARYQELADLVELAIIAESARWGDQAQATPYTVDDWRAQRDYILETYMPQRPAIVLDQLRAAGLYPSVDAPVFYVNGHARSQGRVLPTDQFTMVAPKGQIYYTLDGQDPRIPIARSAPGPAVTLLAEDAPKRVLVPSAADGSQLGNKPAGFQVTFYQANLTVSSLDVAESVISNPSYRTRVVTQTAPVINFFNTGGLGNFGDDKPFPGTTMDTDFDNYVILAVGTIIIPEAGPWTFGVSSDDGFGLKLTGTTQSFTLSYPSPRGPGDTLGVFNVTRPGPYQLRLVFYEQGGGSELELYAGKGSYSSFTSTGLHLLGDLATGIQVGEGNVWFTSTFDDSAWRRGTGGVGYEKGSGYQGLIGLDVGGDMAGKNTTCYVRVPFMADNAVYGDLRLGIRYDDGFIAYLNGVEVARRNFTGDPAWNSAAYAEHPDAAAAVLEDIDITAYAGALNSGSNVLAIHGLNSAPSDDDFLISAQLVARKLTQGDVSPTAIEFKGPFTLTKSTRVRARTLDGQWSALNDVVFAVGPVAEGLRISEIMYHPEDTGDPNDPNTEFVELKNVGAQTINLNLVQFTQGIRFTFGDVDLQPGRAILVVKDLNAFTAKYGQGLPVAGVYEGSLSNAGERLALQDAIARVIHDFTYSDGWVRSTDGGSFSLTVKDPAAIGRAPDALGDKALWQASATRGGSPGY